MTSSTQKSKRKFKMPDTYVLLVFFILGAALLSYILPAGTYETIGDTKTIDPNSFHFIERTPVNPFQAILSISKGMVKASSIIFTVFLVSGAFKVINDTGSIDSAIDSLSNRLKSKVIILIPIIMICMSVLGYLGIIVNQTIVFIPIGLIIARKLKMDPIVGLSMMYLATYSGFIGSGLCPFTVLVAQKIAGLPLLSGIEFRTVVFLFLLVSAIIYLMRYAKKVLDDPSKSILGTDYEWAVEAHKTAEFSAKHKIVLVALFITFGIYIYGAQKLSWGMNELNTVCILLAIFSGVIGGMSLDDMSKSFVAGCKMAVFSALLIGFATAISVVLSQGNIIHTIIYYASMPLGHLSSYLSALFMFFFNWGFNFFVPSGSGQAAVVMPILAPLSDVIGLSKQVTVSAYKYGDGITNLIIPTSGTLMGFIGLAKIPYEKWLKFILPLIGIWTAIAAASLLIGVAIGF
ncbi:YfcC family protein [Fusibacter ferrireducens]|uniref:YfcC family protein n=1 Tax=Fusibacter ferrireducens TaxID=2785058 RepID=A0ABR9ZSV6_9FIRM|nr:TIGR00366 family protein [Fusibacter ferrireducens]MBF4693549.1 YfcC family protein [Fusibacter ferrireducens]